MVKLTAAEYEILNLLWTEGKPLTSTEIVELSADKSWKDSTIHIHLNDLLEKGVIVISGIKKIGRTYARLFDVTLSADEYLTMHLKDNPVYKRDKNQEIKKIVAALVDDKDISKETIAELELMLNSATEKKNEPND